MLSRVEFENMGLNDEKFAKTRSNAEIEGPRNELQMLMELLRSGLLRMNNVCSHKHYWKWDGNHQTSNLFPIATYPWVASRVLSSG